MAMVRLGKKRYIVQRAFSGEWVDGEWVDGAVKKIPILANIQYASASNIMRHLPEGDWTKQAISVRSQQRLYAARTNTTTLIKADVIEFDGSLWECRGTLQTYDNGVLPHTEVIAVRLDEKQAERSRR